MVAPRVYAAMGQNVVGHLDPFFFEIAEQIRSLLGYAFSTKNPFCLAISGTGSAGMETAVANFAEPGRKFAVLSNGFFRRPHRRHGGPSGRRSGEALQGMGPAVRPPG
ncbi:MAG: alanine--glyoxylate aminotransferase family protein, partial [Ignavibacteriota bacterium]